MEIKSALIIDDNDGDQFLSKMILEQSEPGLDVYQAYDGEEALQLLRGLEMQPDIIFLDINMPRMDGLEFLEEYSKSENTSTVAILSTSEQEKDIEKAQSYECVKKYFTKLLDHEDLAEIKRL